MPPLFFTVRLPTWLVMFWRRSICRRPNGRGSPREPRSYIVFRLDALGDVVLTTPLFRALKAAHPECRLTVVVQKANKALLATNPHIDEILTVPAVKPKWMPRRLQRLVSATLLYWTKLRGRDFDFAVSPRWDVDEHLATFLCTLTSATHRVGYSSTTSQAKQKINRGFDGAYDICLSPGPVCHEIARNLVIVERLGGIASDDSLDLRLTERDRRRAAGMLANVDGGTALIALGIGAQSKGRRWPLERFAEVVNRVGATRTVQALIVCSDTELGEAARLSTLLSTTPLILSGAMLREVCAVLERCELFIGNDSGCAHLAAAVDCDSVVISRHPRGGDPNHFNSPVRFAPRGPRVQVLQPPAGRDACKDACLVPGPHCILDVSVADVTLVALQMLDAPLPNADTTANVPLSSLPSPLLRVHSSAAMRTAVESLRANADRASL